MPAWLAAIPVIGDLFDKLGGAIDRNVTTDDERLKAKVELTSLYVPVVNALMEAEKTQATLQARLAEIESKSEHWLVWARRPIISILAVLNFLAVSWMWFLKSPQDVFVVKEVPEVVTFAFSFALVANGIDMTSRGVEKVMKVFRAKEEV